MDNFKIILKFSSRCVEKNYKNSFTPILFYIQLIIQIFSKLEIVGESPRLTMYKDLS